LEIWGTVVQLAPHSYAASHKICLGNAKLWLGVQQDDPIHAMQGAEDGGQNERRR